MRYLAFLLLLVCRMTPVFAGELYQISKTPDWVDSIEVSDPKFVPHEKISNGVHYLLVDRQVLVPPDQQPSFYEHYTSLITNQAGLDQESQINITFDPAYEAVELHEVIARRDGLSINMLDRVRIVVLDQEEDLDNQIYNGKKKINILLEDIRVGDVIEYSYTTTGSNPVFHNIFSVGYPLQWGVPVDHVSVSVFWQKTNKLHSKIFNNKSLELSEHSNARGTKYRISIKNVEPIALEESVPAWVDPYVRISFSEAPSWSSVVDWGMGLFEPAIVGGPAIIDIGRSISSNTHLEERKIIEALQFVQSEIRYVGIELGENSHQASLASTTLHRRYGDCKDKSVLLIALLREFGVKAYPALVNTRLTKELINRLPSRNLFNHVIVFVEYNGEVYWLDATKQYQYGKLNEIYQPNYGQALVLRPASSELVPMGSGGSVTSTIITDRFDVSGEKRDDVTFSSFSVFSGLSAERQRNYLEQDGVDIILKNFLSYYRSYYSVIESTADLLYEDNFQDGKLTRDEKYRIGNFWEWEESENRYIAWVYSNAINSYLKEPKEKIRTQDYEIDFPITVRQEIWVQFSDKEWSFDREDFTENNDFFEFSKKVTFDKVNHMLRVSFYYSSKINHVSAANFPEYLEALTTARNEIDFGFYDYDLNLEPKGSVEEFVESYRLLLGIVLYLCVLLFILILFHIDSRKNPYPGNMKFYPVSVNKFILMWVMTLGFYAIYWFYRNWQYVRHSDNSSSASPLWRAIFFQFWYFPLYLRLSASLPEGAKKVSIPSRAIAVLLSILFVIIVFATVKETTYTYPLELLAALVALPLLHMVNVINRADQEEGAITHNSRWTLKHGFLIILIAPLSVLAVGSELGLLPSEKVVPGDKLLAHDIRFMQRKGILNPRDKVIYFYSDATINIRKDGNGFSDRHVFSYWEDEDNRFNSEVVEFNEIIDIDVVWARSYNENTIVEIFRKNKGKMLLYLSNIENKDKVFVKELKLRWSSKTGNVDT